MAYVKIPVDTTTGDVTGPTSATNNAVALFDGTTGKLLKNSVVTIDGSGNVAGVASIAITGLTPGSVLFAGAGGAISQDNAMFFWDDTNDYLGIGTATPAARLHIAGNRSAASWTTNGIGIRTASGTMTNTTSSGTVAVQAQHGVAQPIFAFSSATTITDAANLYVAGGPIAGSSGTLTRSWGIFVATGSNTTGLIHAADGLFVGTTDTTLGRVGIRNNASNTSAFINYNIGTQTVSSNGSYVHNGVTSDITVASSANNTATNGTRNFYSIIRCAGSSGTLTGAAGFVSQVTLTATTGQTVSNTYGFRHLAATASTGTYTNNIGYQVDDQTAGTNIFGFVSLVTSGANKWGVYSSGNATNYMAGSLTVGTTAASAKLHVVATTEQERIGYDTSNYYSTTVSSAGLVTWAAVGASAGFLFSNRIITTMGTPASSAATGTAGTLQFDDTYLYGCTATNTWKRIAWTTF